MGEPLADFVAKGVSSSSCLCYNTCEKPGCEHSCACWKNEDDKAVISCQQDDLLVEEIGMALTEVMHIDEGSDLDEDSDDDDDDDPILSLESDSTDDLVDVDFESVISSPPLSGDASESSSKSVGGKSSNNGTPKLLSAMKGTRAKEGLMSKLSVSWAPDVYDPPVTSDSHTVRGHQRSSRKGHCKYKPSKSSSSSSSSSRSTSGSKRDKKHSRHGSSSSSSSSSSKKDRKHSHRSTSSGGSIRTDMSSSHCRKAYSSSGISSSTTVTCVPESAKRSPLVLAENATLPEIVPVLKTMESIKFATSCGKEKPFAMLSRQFSPARYKGMFSFWSQNQLAS